MFPVPRYDPTNNTATAARRDVAVKRHKKHTKAKRSDSHRQQHDDDSSSSRLNRPDSSGRTTEIDESSSPGGTRTSSDYPNDDAGGGRRGQEGGSVRETTGSSPRNNIKRKRMRDGAASHKTAYDLTPAKSPAPCTEEAIDDMDLLETPSELVAAAESEPTLKQSQGGDNSNEDDTALHRDPVTMEVEREDDDDHGDDKAPTDGDAIMELEEKSKSKAAMQQQLDLQRAMDVSTKPIEDVARQWKLAPFLLTQLQKAGHQHFFPIQSLVIPFALYQHRVHAFSASGLRCRDVCISAATGSGKTLAYVIPILQALHESMACLGNVLRALVVLPSRDLARQVHAVFETFASGSQLRIGLAVGQNSFESEQRDLLRRGDDDDVDDSHVEGYRRSDLCVASSGLYATDPRRRKRLELEPGNVRLVLDTFWDGGSWGDVHQRDGTAVPTDDTRSRRPSIAVDVLVCTPGRLVDHLERGTMTLEHLNYLVVDEADRLLAQRYHNWIDKVLVEATTRRAGSRSGDHLEELDPCRFRMDPITWRHDSEALGMPANGEGFAGADRYEDVGCRAAQPIQLQKFLVSATLTRDPQKLASLRLNHPIHFSLQSRREEKRYTLPDTLQEFTVECTTEQKPLALIAILLDRLERQRETAGESSRQQIVIFTSSVDSAHRLTRLLQLLWTAGIAQQVPTAFPSKPASESETTLHAVAEVSSSSSSISAKERAARLQSRSILVCSDGLSRGMDLPNVSLVVHYDVPALAKTYVHRCGRTARAGQSGTAIVLLRKGQQAAFAKMRSLIVGDGSSVEAMPIPKPSILKGAIPLYRKCLAALKSVLCAEDEGELGMADESRLQDFLAGVDGD